MDYTGKRVRVTIEGTVSRDRRQEAFGTLTLVFDDGRTADLIREEDIKTLAPKEPPVGSLVKMWYVEGDVITFYATERGWIEPGEDICYPWNGLIEDTTNVEVLYDAG